MRTRALQSVNTSTNSLSKENKKNMPATIIRSEFAIEKYLYSLYTPNGLVCSCHVYYTQFKLPKGEAKLLLDPGRCTSKDYLLHTSLCFSHDPCLATGPRLHHTSLSRITGKQINKHRKRLSESVRGRSVRYETLLLAFCIFYIGFLLFYNRD